MRTSRLALGFSATFLASALAGFGALVYGGIEYFSEYFADQKKPIVTLSAEKQDALLQQSGAGCYSSIKVTERRGIKTLDSVNTQTPITLKECYEQTQKLIKTMPNEKHEPRMFAEFRMGAHTENGNGLYKAKWSVGQIESAIITPNYRATVTLPPQPE